MKNSPHQHGISVKKQHGQNFLRDTAILDRIVAHAAIPKGASVLEIGCGDGALTRALLISPLDQLRVYEIDPEWANHVATSVKDSRLSIVLKDILAVDLPTELAGATPWILVANLPYHITFPILQKLVANPAVVSRGIFMVQEEVAQKLVGNHGRSYGAVSIFFQHYWDLSLHEKIGPDAFFPPPKIDSRLVEFRARENVAVIPQEAEFWRFIKACFHQPRRTLKNNLAPYHYNLSAIPEEWLALRAQQMAPQKFYELWDMVLRATD